MHILEIKLASSSVIYDVLPKCFATISKIPKNEYIKVQIIDSAAADGRDHFVASDCIEDVKSMAELLQNKLGGDSSGYLTLLKYFMD